MMRSRWSPADPIAMRLSYITANSRQTWRLPSSLISTMDLTVFFQKMYLMRWSMSKQHSPWCRLLWMEEWLQCSCLVNRPWWPNNPNGSVVKALKAECRRILLSFVTLCIHSAVADRTIVYCHIWGYGCSHGVNMMPTSSLSLSLSPNVSLQAVARPYHDGHRGPGSTWHIRQQSDRSRGCRRDTKPRGFSILTVLWAPWESLLWSFGAWSDEPLAFRGHLCQTVVDA